MSYKTLAGAVTIAFGVATGTQADAAEKCTFAGSGKVSWYGPGFHGRITANGEKYNSFGISAAHKKLPFGTHVKVVATDGRTFSGIRINDRGPYKAGRILDVSRGVAEQLEMIKEGTISASIFVCK